MDILDHEGDQVTMRGARAGARAPPVITMGVPGQKPTDTGSGSQKAACRAPGAAPGKRPWGGSQSAGPAVRVTVAVWDWPDWSVQPMLILSPGWYFPSTGWMSEEDETV